MLIVLFGLTYICMSAAYNYLLIWKCISGTSVDAYMFYFIIKEFQKQIPPVFVKLSEWCLGSFLSQARPFDISLLWGIIGPMSKRIGLGVGICIFKPTSALSMCQNWSPWKSLFLLLTLTHTHNIKTKVSRLWFQNFKRKCSATLSWR